MKKTRVKKSRDPVPLSSAEFPNIGFFRIPRKFIFSSMRNVTLLLFLHEEFRKVMKYCIYVYCLASANPIGEIGSGYPTNVYDGNRLSLPILRQKMALSDV
jgi:hypothetical protein